MTDRVSRLSVTVCVDTACEVDGERLFIPAHSIAPNGISHFLVRCLACGATYRLRIDSTIKATCAREEMQ